MHRWFLACTSVETLRVEVPRDSPVVLGRAPDARIVLPPDDDTASRYHAVAQLVGDRLAVRDLGSRNGLFVNDQRTQNTWLENGDILRVGRLAFRVQGEAMFPESRETQDVVPIWAQQTANAGTYRCHGCGTSGPSPSAAFAGDAGAPWLCVPCAQRRMTPRETWPERVAQQIGSWTILRFLGYGGMSIVFEARHATEGLHAALKLLRSAAALEAVGRKRFAREQRLMTTLRHPSIVRAFEVGEDQKELFIASELVTEGEADALASPTTPLPMIWTLAADLFAALAFAHSQTVVHRDIKPSNLLLTRGIDAHRPYRGKLNDFGLAKSFRDMGGSFRTADGEVAGTAEFMPPEQALGLSGAGMSADLYSAAASIYYLLTKELPLAVPPGQTLGGFAQLCVATLTHDRVPLRQRRPDVPEDVAQWIDLLVAREPAQRMGVSTRMLASRFAAIAGLP